ncbi:hypothetical protein DFJ43DRAFT_1086588 [Lentinula guzmanii]|uniref:CoA-dependent acyltransferase n=1 Tax=Lentinula guzmanii TaxID=2804957 RepID=A0AA38J789_9AGAR|nr:hypothetical protein DFJ43DRAFT_1086588 [Lentinula guzmanii]
MAVYNFCSTDGKTYKRNLHGFEALCNSYALHDFLLSFTGSAEVQLSDASGTPASHEKVISCLRAAWILLRYRVPGVALRTTYQPKDTSWTVFYDVPLGSEDIDTWVSQTLFWRETRPGCLVHELDEKWEFTHGEYPLRLMASPIEAGRYMLSLSGPHGMMDGRMSMILLNELIGSLHTQIYESATVDLKAIKWGEEIARLASTGAVLTGLDMNSSSEPAAQEKELVPFLPPFVENKDRTHDVTMRLVVFDDARTLALRQKCRENHTTVTIAVDAIFACAQAEAVLASAATIGGAHYTSTVEAYNKALHWFMPLSCKDQRPSWPTSSSIDHPEGTTLFGTDGFALQANIDIIRNALGFSVDAKSFNRCDNEFFWSSVIKEIAAAHEIPKKDLAGYVQREREKQEMCKTFHPSSMMVKLPISSSIGDFDHLGLFGRYLPSSTSPTKVHRVLFRARPLTPTITNIFYQYDGRLNCSLLAAAQWYSPPEMDEMETALRTWFDLVIGTG